MSSKSKAKRSSILKPAKPRNPLSDLDLNPTMESTFIRQSRRVSFANNNFIKEFASDPEKNTIWDTTYEEAINKSDHSSEGLPSKDENSEINTLSEDIYELDDFNCTRLEDFADSIEVMLDDDKMETSYVSADIELVPPAANMPMEPVLCPPAEHNAQVTHVNSQSKDLCAKSLWNPHNVTREDKIDKEIVQMSSSNNYCVPCQNNAAHVNEIDKENNLNYYQSTVLNTVTNLENAKSNSLYSNLQKIPLQQTPNQTALCNKPSADAQMKIYQNAAAATTDILNENPSLYLKYQHTDYTGNNKMNSDCSYMQEVGCINKITDASNVSSHTKLKHLHTPMPFDSRYDNFTKRTTITALEKQYEVKSREKSINFNTNAENDSLKMTIPISNTNPTNPASARNLNRRTIHFNKESEDAEMDVTQSHPVAISTLKEQTVHFNQAPTSADMDITLTATKMDKINNSTVKRQTIHFNKGCKNAELDMTKHCFPTTNVDKRNDMKQQTIYFDSMAIDDEMEITETLLPNMNILLKKCNINKTTQTPSSVVTSKFNNGTEGKEDISKRRTINFTQTSAEANMELTIAGNTESLPNNTISSKKFTPNAQIIRFNEVVQDNEMENSELIPDEMDARLRKHNFADFDNLDTEITKSIPKGSKMFCKRYKEILKEQTVGDSNTASSSVNIMGKKNDANNLETAQDNMEITPPVPASSNNDNQGMLSSNIADNSKGQTIQFNNMPVYNTDNEISNSNMKRQTIHFNATSEGADLDITESGPITVSNMSQQQTIHSNNTSKVCEMEMRQLHPAVSKLIKEKNADLKQTTQNFRYAFEDAPFRKEANTKHQTIHFDNTSEGADMSVTQHNQIVSSIRDKQMDANNKRQTIHFNLVSEEAEMDMTQSYPSTSTAIGKSKFENSKRRTVHFNNDSQDAELDVTETISAGVNLPLRKGESSAKHRTIHFDNASEGTEMNITQHNQILSSTRDKQTHAGNKQQTIHFNVVSEEAEMDMTQSYPSTSTATGKSKVENPKRKTIHFNNDSEDAEMDVTETLSVGAVSTHKRDLRKASQDVEMEVTLACSTKVNTSLKRKMTICEDLTGKRVSPNHEREAFKKSEIKAIYFGTHLENTQSEMKNDKLGCKQQSSHVNNNNDNMTRHEIISKQILEEQQTTNLNELPSKIETVNSNHGSRMYNIDISGIAAMENSSVDKQILGNQPSINKELHVEGNAYFNQTFKNVDDETIQSNLSDKYLNIDKTEIIQKDQILISPDLRQDVLIPAHTDNNESTENDICQVIYIPDQDNNYTSFINSANSSISKHLCLSHPSNECDHSPFSLSKNLSSYVDDTEKLINYRISDKPTSEYSKIINEEINLSALESSTLKDKNDLHFFVQSPNCSKSKDDVQLSNLEDSCAVQDKITEMTMADVSAVTENVNVASCDTHSKQNHKASTKANFNKNVESFILINSCSDNGSYNKIDSSLINEDISMPPVFPEFDNSSSAISDNSFYTPDHNNSLKSFVEKSIQNKTTILSESISLIQSINSDTSNDFLAVSFAAREVEKMLNKTILKEGSINSVEENTSGVPESICKNPPRISHLLNEVFPTPSEELQIPDDIVALIEKETTKKERKWHRMAYTTITKLQETKVLTLEETIRQKSNDTMWDIISVNNDELTFTFMFASIEFILNIDRVTENVKSIRVFKRFNESVSHPSAVYVHSILKKKLSQNYIKSACGQTYTIFTFLDYITITGQQMNDIMTEFDKLEMQYGVVLDSNLNASCSFTNIDLRVAFDVSFNILNLESISEEQVSVKSVVGNIRAADIKRLAKGCPQGLSFIRVFILSINEYLKIQQKTKGKRISEKLKKVS